MLRSLVGSEMCIRDRGVIIGYLLISTNNSVRTRVEVELTNAKVAAEKKLSLIHI